MADKEATLFVVDVGKSMGTRRNGRDETDLDWGMRYVWDRITATVATGRKTACVGVIAFRSDETKNSLALDDEAYQHISVLQPLAQLLMPNIRDLSQMIKPSNTNQGDAISALVVAVQMMAEFTKRLKYKRRIILVTNAQGDMDTDGVEDIANKIQEDGIELIVLGADFDDPEFGVKEESKDATKQYNEDHFKSLTAMCNGVCGTLQQAVSELGMPRVKSVRPVQSYRGLLTLGDPNTFETAMCIDVERFPRTTQARPPTASNFVVGHESSSTQLGQSDEREPDGPSDLTSVRHARAYVVSDEKAPGGKRDVDREELDKGYAYGQTAVPIAEADENVTKFESIAGLEIMGFIPRVHYEHYMGMSKTNIVMAQRTNAKAVLALSSFVHALYELDNFAVARLVPKADKNPVIVLLAPSIEPDFECLIDVELPFAEDVRSYKFPPLDRIVTLSGKTITEHRNLPSKDLRSAMDDYVDSFDISRFGRDDEGEACEYMPFDDTFSPVLHRINQAIGFRAVHPDTPVPPPAEVLTKYMKPPEELLKSASSQIRALRELADVKKVPPKVASRRRDRDNHGAEKPRSGLDVAALLAQRSKDNRRKISKDNAIPEFKQYMAVGDDLDSMRDAVGQLSTLIHEWISASFGDVMYGKVIEAMAAMKEECVEIEEPGLYNSFIRDLKTKIHDGSLGGDRGELWWKIRAGRLGLIDRKLCSVSEVAEEEKDKFYRRSP